MGGDTKLMIRGVEICFPFAPYDVQVRYMEAVIECLQTNRNGVLESPTGTGKTLCLLCAALAWQDSEIKKREKRPALGVSSVDASNSSTVSSTNSDFPLVVFTSRTHAQPAQALRVLRRTAYGHKRAVVLGARDQLCVHPRVVGESSAHAKRALCRALVRERACAFYNKLDALTRRTAERTEGQLAALGAGSDQLADIEDLVVFGKRERICPYYLVATLRARAEIVFAPYNYVLDAQVRRANNVELRGAALVIDEAHNVERICEDAASFDVSSTDLATGIRDLRELGRQLLDTQATRHDSQSAAVYREDGSIDESFEARDTLRPDFSVEDIATLKDCLHKLEESLDAISLDVPSGPTPRWAASAERSRIFDGDYVFEWLSQGGVELRNAVAVSDALERVTTHLANSSVRGGRPVGSRGAGLTRVNDLVRLAFALDITPSASASTSTRSTSFLDDRSSATPGRPGRSQTAVTTATALKLLGRLSTDSQAGNLDAQTTATLKRLARCYKVYIRDGPAANGRFTSNSNSNTTNVRKRRAGGWDADGAADPDPEPADPDTPDEQRGGRIFSFWCFSASRTMADLRNEGIRSLVLTSGTLSPIQSFIDELDILSPVVLQNPHIVTDKQILCGVVKNGADGSVLNASYENRSTEQYQNALGITILNLFRIVPHGVLVFFPSYTLMDSCIQFWKSRATWSQFESAKRIFVEPRRKNELAQVITEYNNDADSERVSDAGSGLGLGLVPNARAGAALFGVCRGKVSEGVDFADRRSRAVLVIGLPYPNATEPRVRLKMSFLDERRSQLQLQLKNVGKACTTSLLTGRDWYSQQAIRAVNQSCGRAIRHRFDYGVVLLLDTRFAYSDSRTQLSGWLRSRTREYDARFGAVIRDVREFFREAVAFDAYLPQAAVESEKESDKLKSASDSRATSSNAQETENAGGKLALDFDPTWLVRPPRMPGFLSTSRATGSHKELFTFSCAQRALNVPKQTTPSDTVRADADSASKPCKKSLLSALGSLEQSSQPVSTEKPQSSADTSTPECSQKTDVGDDRVLQSFNEGKKRLRLVPHRL